MLIGLCGFIGSGKDTVANILKDDHGYNKIAMADPLKDAVAVMFGWSRYLLQGDTQISRTFRETPDDYWSAALGRQITPRRILQEFGTEIVREQINKDFWVHAMRKKLQMYENVVIPDVRFYNEIQMVKDEGGVLIQISRGPDPEWVEFAKTNPMFMKVEYPDVHESEWRWLVATPDYTIHNNGGIYDLNGQINDMLNTIGNGGTR